MNNLKAEMARYGVTEKNIQEVLESGVTEFSFPECIKIRNKFFEGYKLEYLFAQDNSKSA